MYELEIPHRFIQFLPLHPGRKKFYLYIAKFKLLLQHILLRPRIRTTIHFPSSSPPSSFPPSSLTSSYRDPASANLHAPLPYPPSYILQKHIIIHHSPPTILIHRHV